ncbi:unnamed protein product [Spodoptera exigua]|nr:unnamed protein product [Spodoptera exigua]
MASPAQEIYLQLAMTILAYAGKDLSHWFKNGEWVHYIHPITGSEVTYRIHGHSSRQPVVPSTRWRPLEEPWWDGDKYVVGKATARTRPIRITNTLTGSTVTLDVCSEETIYEIMMRYLPHNSHLMSYTWRYMGRGLCLNKTLEENGIPDERDRFSDVSLAENIHIPAILIYYNDDLTEVTLRCDGAILLLTPQQPQLATLRASGIKGRSPATVSTGLRSASKGSSPPDQNRARAYGA